jgi:hypothetical protein
MCVVRSRWALLSSGWWAPLNWAFCQPASVSITPYAVQAYRRLFPVRDENTCRHPMSTKDSKEVSAFVGPRESAQCLYWRRSVSYCANHDEKGQVVACFARRITLLYRVLLVLVQPEWSAPSPLPALPLHGRFAALGFQLPLQFPPGGGLLSVRRFGNR